MRAGEVLQHGPRPSCAASHVPGMSPCPETERADRAISDPPTVPRRSSAARPISWALFSAAGRILASSIEVARRACMKPALLYFCTGERPVRSCTLPISPIQYLFDPPPIKNLLAQLLVRERFESTR